MVHWWAACTPSCGFPAQFAPVYLDVKMFHHLCGHLQFPLQVCSSPLFPFLPHWAGPCRLHSHELPALLTSARSSQWEASAGLEPGGEERAKCLFPTLFSALLRVGCVPSIKHKTWDYLALHGVKTFPPLHCKVRDFPFLFETSLAAIQ